MTRTLTGAKAVCCWTVCDVPATGWICSEEAATGKIWKFWHRVTPLAVTHAFPSVSAVIVETCRVTDEFPLLSVVLPDALKLPLPAVMVYATFSPAPGAPFVSTCVVMGISSVLPCGTQVLGEARETSNEPEARPSRVVFACWGDE